MKTLTLDPSVAGRGVAVPHDRSAGAAGSLVATAVRVAVVVLIAAFGVLMLGSVVGPKVLPYKAYFVRSGSMRPTIPVGALALYRPVEAAQLRPGDVIAFARPGTGDTISHRITSIDAGPEGRVFVTKGDANSSPDDWRVPAIGKGWRYSWHVPVIGYAVGGLGSVQGRLTALLVVGMLLMALALRSIWRPSTPAAAEAVSLPVVAPLAFDAPAPEAPRPERATVRRDARGDLDQDWLSPSIPYRNPLRPLGGGPPGQPTAQQAAGQVAEGLAAPTTPPRPESLAIPAASDVADCLTIISCHARLLLRSTPTDDPRRAGLLAIVDAAQRAASGGAPDVHHAPLRSGAGTIDLTGHDA